jgi:hypothetical protein
MGIPFREGRPYARGPTRRALDRIPPEHLSLDQDPGCTEAFA